MKKVAIGCLIVFVIALVGLGVAGFYAYRMARPVFDNARNYLDTAQEVAKLGDDVRNKTPFEPPANGELTQAQMERFLAVRARVRDDLADRWDQIQKKGEELRQRATAEKRQDLTLTDFTSVFGDVMDAWIIARKSQVNALNIHKFSDAEYSWVRNQIHAAAGMELAGAIDLAAMASGQSGAAEALKDLPTIDVPEANRELVRPHLSKLKEWAPLAALGL